MSKRRLLLGLYEIAVPLLLVAGWQVITERADSFYFPPPSRILSVFIDVWLGSGFFEHAIPSLYRMFVGFGIGALLGASVGVAIGMSSNLRTTVHPVLEFLRALPAVVLVPFGIVVFGIDDAMKIFIIAVGVIFPVLLNTVDGVGGVDRNLLDVAKSFRFSRPERVWRVVLPAAAPQIFSGLRVGLAVALILMIVSEMVASNNGIGYFILHAQRLFRVTEMWSGIVFLGILGYAINAVFLLIERKLLAWHRGARASALTDAGGAGP